jgi:hypothetical protein
MSYPRPPLEDRFWKAVSPCPNTGCWLWEGTAIGAARYSCGGIRDGGKYLKATHVSLMLHGQPRPTKDAIACHHCDVPMCVNPDHLYWGSHSSNALDAFARGRRTQNVVAAVRRRSRTHCPNGHEFTPENTFVRRGAKKQQRVCRACQNIANRAYRLHRKAKRDAVTA